MTSPNKGGRPSLAANKRRNKTIYVAVTEQEHTRLTQEAATCNRPLATYVREVVLGHSLSSRADRAAARELHYLGVNLNQLARIANRSRQIELEDKLRTLLNDIKQAKETLLS